jgi:nucleotide-binding universal stress UspA family protein
MSLPILCATDFSKPAQAAVDVAAALAGKMKRPLRLLHCGQDWIVMGELPVMDPDDREVLDQLKGEAARLRATGIEVTEEFRRGSPGFEIVAAAAEQPTGMIVLGATGKGMAERWLIGSVAERVAESAEVPTLVVRQADVLLAWLREEGMLRLFCGVDFTASADTAIAAAHPLMELGQVEVGAVHVLGAEYPRLSNEQQVTRQRDVWERLRERLGDVAVKVHVCSSTEQPALDFLSKAAEEGAGLLVVGAHQRSGLQRLRRYSFSRGVLEHAKTNVLCVPAVLGSRKKAIPSIRRILLPTDFSPVCGEALRYAQSLLPSGGTIHLLHVCLEPSRSVNLAIASELYIDHSLETARVKEEAVARLAEICGDVAAGPGVTLSSEALVHSDVAAAVFEVSERMGADLICMGTKGHSRAGAALLGSTVQSVLALVHRPVLAVKATED